MTNASSSNTGLIVLGVATAALGVAVAASSKASSPATGSSGTTKPATGSSSTKPATGSSSTPITTTAPTTTPTKPTTTAPTTTPTVAPAPTTGNVPAGPSWAGEPSVNANTLLDKRTDDLAAFLAKAQPLQWAASPKARRIFASELVAAANAERYPLDLLVGHAWAEGALKPYMTPTSGSGAYGPLQVTAIACADVGMSYPPRSVQEACVVGIRLLRLYAKRHDEASSSITNALRIYGLGYGGFRQFQAAGCSGTPCARSQSVWRHECGCSGAANRYTWKVNAMARRAAAAKLHSLPWAAWRAK